ncbi:MAG: hypothetical protein AB7V42_16285 [Thermoleophilia bacterium]
MPASELRAWLGAHSDRLEALLTQEIERADEEGQLEAALAAHLRLVLDGLVAVGRPSLRRGLEELAIKLDEVSLAKLDDVVRERLQVGEAIEFETRVLFGVSSEDDPSLAAMVERRTRVAALVRTFLGLLEGADSSLAGLSARVHAWLTENQRTLGVLTRQALERQVSRHDGDEVAAAERLSTVALVQANAMVLTLGLAATGEVIAAA